MAENIDWILANRPKGTQALVWAHDSHVCRGEASDPEENYFLGECMGAHLSQKYGSDYRAFGLFTYQGKCRGTISYSNLTFTEFNLFTSPGGSLDAGLHHAATARNSPNLMLDLRPLKNNKDYRWMNIRRPVRYAGYVAEDYGFGGRYVIPYQFDGIIFIDTTSAAQGIR